MTARIYSADSHITEHPDTYRVLRAQAGHLRPAQRDMILHDNIPALYGLA